MLQSVQVLTSNYIMSCCSLDPPLARDVNLISSISLYTHIPNIKSISQSSAPVIDNKYINWTKPYNYKPSIYRTYGSPHSRWIRYPLHQRGCLVNICVLFLDFYNYSKKVFHAKFFESVWSFLWINVKSWERNGVLHGEIMFG